MSETLDTTRLSFMLNDLRLPTIKHPRPKFAKHSDKEGWPAARLRDGREQKGSGSGSGSYAEDNGLFNRSSAA